MIKHKILARHSGVEASERLSVQLIKMCVRAVLRHEGVDMPCEVSVLVTDNKKIRELNLEYRGIYAATDVLSFPMQVFSPPGWAFSTPEAPDPETGLLPLGEIVLSGQCVDQQARAFGQTRERETAYLTIHSVLHLLGYDHIEEQDKKVMRAHEKAIMEEIGYDGRNAENSTYL